MDFTVWILLFRFYCLDFTVWVLLFGFYCLDFTSESELKSMYSRTSLRPQTSSVGADDGLAASSVVRLTKEILRLSCLLRKKSDYTVWWPRFYVENSPSTRVPLALGLRPGSAVLVRIRVVLFNESLVVYVAAGANEV